MQFTTVLALTLASLSAVSAAPAPVKRAGGSGQATYFAVGLGSCGWQSQPGDFVVAMNSAQANGGSLCGKRITVQNNQNGQQADAVVVDECPTCGWGSLDLSEGLFSNLNNGNMDAGVFSITWWQN